MWFGLWNIRWNCFCFRYPRFEFRKSTLGAFNRILITQIWFVSGALKSNDWTLSGFGYSEKFSKEIRRNSKSCLKSRNNMVQETKCTKSVYKLNSLTKRSASNYACVQHKMPDTGYPIILSFLCSFVFPICSNHECAFRRDWKNFQSLKSAAEANMQVSNFSCSIRRKRVAFDALEHVANKRDPGLCGHFKNMPWYQLSIA